MFNHESLIARWDETLHEAVRLREATALSLAMIVGHDQTIIARTPYLEVDLV